MRVMILEDDPWNADLLKQIILSIRPSARIECFSLVQAAIEAWELASYQLVVTEWDLPDASGVNLLKKIRRTDSAVALVIITGLADRASIMSVRPLGISAFISKPFQVKRVVESLAKLIPEVEPLIGRSSSDVDFLTHLGGLASSELDLPLKGDVREQMLRYLNGDEQDLRTLADSWQHDPALCARLVAVANSTAYNVEGRPCLNHVEALRKLGLQTSLNLAVGMALRQFTEQKEPWLKQAIESQLSEIDRLSERASVLAKQCGVAHAPLHTAALLHRMGELCVLYIAQVWVNNGHELDEEQLNTGLAKFSGPFAVSLKVNLNLPMPLRELIGAVYNLPQTQVRREQVVMRLAAAELLGEKAAVLDRLKRLAGLV